MEHFYLNSLMYLYVTLVLNHFSLHLQFDVMQLLDQLVYLAAVITCDKYISMQFVFYNSLPSAVCIVAAVTHAQPSSQSWTLTFHQQSTMLVWLLSTDCLSLVTGKVSNRIKNPPVVLSESVM